MMPTNLLRLSVTLHLPTVFARKDQTATKDKCNSTGSKGGSSAPPAKNNKNSEALASAIFQG
jgi:hypothetical protein